MADKRQETQALGRAIREVRVERGFTQEGFAGHAGMDRSYYGAIERGEFNVTLSTIYKIADGFGIGAGELLDRVQL
ncbi:MAG TPA: helix-turn-helix transcriptional regulator [Solirubrobacteraceae bacterium]|nr:helix-turn-helix transcriptional regulator [Solirubrobacteraceae bacterium]